MALVARLHPAALASLPAALRQPRFDRRALRCGIVHLGLGAFARAHLAVMCDDAIEATGDLGWGIGGVSLRHPDVRDALAPQDGLYTLALRDGAGERLRVIGALRELLVAPENPDAVLARIAHPDTRILSLTITEKGYCHDAASGALRLEHPDIAHDLTRPDGPRSAIGFIVFGLAQRRAQGLGGVTLMSLDNLPANGDTLRRLVLAFAAKLDAALSAWIAAECTFPNSMVDRIVPRCTDADRERIAHSLGVMDAAPVVAEPYIEWVVEDRFAAGRPAWVAGGAAFVDHAAPWEQRKLRLVNGAHSAIAYLGVAAGWATVDEAMQQPALRRYIAALMREEIAPTLQGSDPAELAKYQQRLLQRFANPALVHRTAQIATDGSQKLPQRLLATLRERLAAKAPVRLLALAIAGWLHHLRGHDDAGRRYAIDDPLAADLHTLHVLANAQTDATQRARVFCSFTPVFGDLADAPALWPSLGRQLHDLQTKGAADTLAQLDA